MDVDSLAWRTDLALLEHAGSEVEDRGDHLVVRTPAKPHFYWGHLAGARVRRGLGAAAGTGDGG